MTIKSIAGIDHAVVVVKDLDAAAANWKQLGFTISPRGTHSARMGSGNFTIMLDPDYIELLGVLAETEHNAPTRAFLASRGIRRREGDALDAAAGRFQIGPGRRVVLGGGEHAEQLHVIVAEHDGVIAGAHMRAMGAARRDGEAELFPVACCRIEVFHRDDSMIDSGYVFDGHACTMSLLSGTVN